MIIYNITVKVATEIHDNWVNWMKEIHIPEVMDTQLFEKYYFSRIINHKEEGGTSYSIQYHCESMAVFHKYQVNHAPGLQKKHIEKYGEKALAFRTLMDIID